MASERNEAPLLSAQNTRRLHWLLLVVLAAYCVGIVIRVTPRVPSTDDYARYALGIVDYGIYGPVMEIGTEPEPSMGRAPLYPLFQAVFLRLDPAYYDYLTCYYGPDEDADCGTPPLPLRLAQMAVYLLCMPSFYHVARMIGAHPAFAMIATLGIAGMMLPFMYFNAYTEALALPLHGVLTYLTARYLYRDTPRRDALLAGLVLGLLVLLRFAYQYYLPLLLLLFLFGRGFPLREMLRWPTLRTTLAAVLLAATGYAVIAVPWMLRNQQAFGDFALGESGSTGVLSARVQYNSMNTTEYATSFLYWFPFVGEAFTEAVLPESAWGRLNMDNPDGFRQQNRVVRRELAAQGLSEDEIRAELLGEIRANIPNHVAVAVPLSLRGVRNAVFFLWAVPFFLYFVVRRRMWRAFFALSAGWFILAFHAGATHFIPRYGWPLVIDFGIMAALVATLLAVPLAKRIRRPILPPEDAAAVPG